MAPQARDVLRRRQEIGLIIDALKAKLVGALEERPKLWEEIILSISATAPENRHME